MRDLKFYHEIEDIYEELLDDAYESASICGINYAQGHALRNIDPIAFGCSCSDWSGEEYQELSFGDLTEEEREHYLVSEHQTMYCHVDDENGTDTGECHGYQGD